MKKYRYYKTKDRPSNMYTTRIQPGSIVQLEDPYNKGKYRLYKVEKDPGMIGLSCEGCHLFKGKKTCMGYNFDCTSEVKLVSIETMLEEL